MIGKKSISKMGEALAENLKKELRDQGHYLTGRLERSITQKASDEVLEITAEDYITDLEEGRDPNQIEVSAKYIQELAEYAKLRMGATGKEALRIGYLIAKKHAKEGMPTKNSYQYSNNGLRTEAIEHSYSENENQTDSILTDGLSRELDELIDQTFDETIF